MTKLHAGILAASATCPHCSRPTGGGGALRCACGGSMDRRGPRHGLAEAFLGAFPGRLHA